MMNKGFGIEDLETCERVFSGSNLVARSTRHSTAYHRRQFIELYFQQWDEDKYSALGVFIYNNYKQALDLLQEMPIKIRALLSGQDPSEVPFNRWLREEREYLESKKTEPDENVFQMEYIERLQKYEDAKNIWESSLQLTNQAIGFKARSRAYQLWKDAFEVMIVLQKELQSLEARLDIGSRWRPGSPEYVKALEYLQHRTYYLAVDKLEGLVVQRLFELSKANASGTGYKLRMHIAKSLTSRSKAIRHALNAYNIAAAQLNPPRPKLTWSHIVEYSTIAEFELLRAGFNGDIRNAEWMDKRNREATLCCLKLERAQEEIKCLNIEIGRLENWISKELAEFKAITDACSADEPLKPFLADFIKRRTRLNFKVQSDLRRIYKLSQYSGNFPLESRTDCVDEEDMMDITADGFLEDAIDDVYNTIQRIVDD